MTIDIPTRPAEQQAPEPPRRGMRRGPQITLGRSRAVDKTPLVVGAQPRANLLPPEVIVKRQQLKTRRGLRVGVLLVALGTVAACAATFGVSSVAQLQLQAAQDTQESLVLEQAQYQDVSEVQATIKTIAAGQQVGASTEINWQSYLTTLQTKLPSDVVLQNIVIESGTPMLAYQQSDLPLQGSRVAGLTFTATSATLPSIPDWLRGLATLKGFVDATPGTVKQVEGIYAVQVVMHINTDAFSLRYDPEHMVQVAAEEAAAAAHADAQLKSMVAAPPADTTDAGDGTADDSATDGEGN